jgi:hypothetical protein
MQREIAIQVLFHHRSDSKDVKRTLKFSGENLRLDRHAAFPYLINAGEQK